MEDCYLVMSLAGISCKKQHELIKKFGSSQNLWMSFLRNHTLKGVLSDDEIEKIGDIVSTSKLNDFKFGLQKVGINYLTIESENYSKMLKNIFDPPTVLYYKGDVNLLSRDSLAIVGSRLCTHYGMEQTQIFAKALSKSGLVIVSGLAEGIDGIAQKQVVECGGKTIAVLAGGLNHIYPSVHKKLAEQIVENGGLLISENLPNFLPKTYSFVQRNRIIAGLCLGVFVPEAGEKSGSLHTVDFANDNGRSIFALPGPVSSSKSKGTNNLIKFYQGCCVTEPNDIIDDFPQLKKQKVEKQKFVQLSFDEQLVLNALFDETLHYDMLIEKTKLNSKELNGLLVKMEIKGLVKRLPGNEFCKKN